MPEHAIAIARVSTIRQHEEDQSPELVKYADRKGYVLDAVVPIRGKSAFHGKQVKHVLAAVDRHVRHGEATIVIFRHVDRSSRQGAFEGYDLLKKIMDAGATVEFSAQEFLNDQPGILGLFFELAKDESKIKRDRKLQGNASRSQRGELVGKPPWGYMKGVVDGLEILVPTDLGREWIPAIFNAAVKGASLRSIQEMLEGIPSPQRNGHWNEASIRRLIANPTYHGGRVGKGAMEYEPLVTVELWQQANLAVESRHKKGRGTVKLEPALVKPYCAVCWGIERDGAPSGKSPMYRVSRNGHDYYHCKGHGPARKSCGAKLVPIPELDGIIEKSFSEYSERHYEIVYIPGDDKAEQLASIDEKMATAARKGDMAAVTELMQQHAEIESLPVRKARSEVRYTDRTEAEYFASLSPEERREYLADFDIIAGKDDSTGAYAIILTPAVHGLKTPNLKVAGNLPGPSLLDRAKARGIDKLVDAEASEDNWPLLDSVSVSETTKGPTLVWYQGRA